MQRLRKHQQFAARCLHEVGTHHLSNGPSSDRSVTAGGFFGLLLGIRQAVAARPFRRLAGSKGKGTLCGPVALP
jgi:hypothetical protein